MRTAILSIKPIDDHGVVDTEKGREITLQWEDWDFERLAFNIGDFIITAAREIEDEVLGEDEQRSEDELLYAEALPAFDLTLEMREK